MSPVSRLVQEISDSFVGGWRNWVTKMTQGLTELLYTTCYTLNGTWNNYTRVESRVFSGGDDCNKVGYALFNSWPTRQQWVLQDTSYDSSTNAVPEGQHETVVNTNNMNTRIYSNIPSNIQVWCDRVVPNDVTRTAHINYIEVDVRARVARAHYNIDTELPKHI